ncbi:hypothetical protein WNZ14_22460 [Hoeflea sp. AS60]|uniref:hypothetical protein n=1 Tax=Hoeflea sp. AS60 TaxID=3135780 RepID=UPI00316B2918
MQKLVTATQDFLYELAVHENTFVRDVFKDFSKGDYHEVAFWLGNEEFNDGDKPDYRYTDVTVDALTAAVKADVGTKSWQEFREQQFS